jgi:hypothetical protein
MLMVSCSGGVVENMTHIPKIEGLNPAGTGREENGNKVDRSLANTAYLGCMNKLFECPLPNNDATCS